MQKLADLQWSDIKSSTMDSDEFMKKFENKPQIKKNFRNYRPKEKVLNEIREIILKKKEVIRIFIMGADWCPDCSINIPRTIKIIKILDIKDVEMLILYGIKVNPLRKKDELLWSKSHSPPEAVNPKFDLTAIPTFYIFNKNGDFIGRIVENPQKFDTLEEEILDILKVN